VLDLGSGAGADVLISAKRVGETGKAIGLDMTDEMLELARRNASEAGVSNVEFLKGYMEEIPLQDASVDVVISNCVVNLSADKPKVLREAARVLRPGGRFAISDVIADEDMDDETRADVRQWTGCIAGALTRREFEQALADAGLADVEIRETHRVHEHAGAAIIRARKPRFPATVGLERRPVDEMDLPMAPDCGLDGTGLRLQLERYRRVGRGASLIERTPRRLSVELDDRIDGQLVGELLGIERECCSFLESTWHPDERRLTFAVSSAEHEAALEGISLALGLATPARL
jgi:SAM-dependent methyltransferase